ncbi:hypothetical protein E2C01_008005 [Portunus trituberculatus]|uniref:Uncharacterized protein n=1 Tax=Portunus trituberculatus TaxID=210409 RepID=A0A5B7D0M6_PORTR|nr:hypothetical protein [Portunus trituberculatus]
MYPLPTGAPRHAAYLAGRRRTQPAGGREGRMIRTEALTEGRAKWTGPQDNNTGSHGARREALRPRRTREAPAQSEARVLVALGP